MGKVEVSKAKNKIWGSCAKLTNGEVEILVSLEFGPRVIHLSRVGMENMMFQDPERKPIDRKVEEFEDQFILYGGHRLWISPEVLPRCYYPDNKPVKYEKITNGASFTAPVELHNNIQKIIRITLDENAPVVHVEHEVKNCGNWDIEFAL